MLVQPQDVQSNTTHSNESSVHRSIPKAGIIRRGTRSRLTTEEFATSLGLEAQSIRKRLCQTGSYYDIVPVKLPNGRLMWPINAIDSLLGTEGDE